MCGVDLQTGAGVICGLVLLCVVGQMRELKDVFVQSIALGKAFGVILTSKGHVYTFGVNNKGQCGREYVPSASGVHNGMMCS